MRDNSLLRYGIEFTLGEDLIARVKVAILEKISNMLQLANDCGTYCATTRCLTNRIQFTLG